MPSSKDQRAEALSSAGNDFIQRLFRDSPITGPCLDAAQRTTFIDAIMLELQRSPALYNTMIVLPEEPVMGKAPLFFHIENAITKCFCEPRGMSDTVILRLLMYYRERLAELIATKAVIDLAALNEAQFNQMLIVLPELLKFSTPMNEVLRSGSRTRLQFRRLADAVDQELCADQDQIEVPRVRRDRPTVILESPKRARAMAG